MRFAKVITGGILGSWGGNPYIPRVNIAKGSNGMFNIFP